jgi:hypothetical protein
VSPVQVFLTGGEFLLNILIEILIPHDFLLWWVAFMDLSGQGTLLPG